MDNPNANQTQGKAIVSAFKTFNENWLMHLEIWDHQAKVSKAKYDAAIMRGFTPDQALDICTKSWSL